MSQGELRSIPKYCFVAKQINETLFCCDTSKYGIFCRKLLKYALRAKKWLQVRWEPTPHFLPLCAYDRCTTTKFLIRNLSYKCKSARQQIQDNDDDEDDQRIFKMISFRNGNICKYGGSHHKSSLLARSHTAHADVQAGLEIGIEAERVWHSCWRSTAYIWMLL